MSSSVNPLGERLEARAEMARAAVAAARPRLRGVLHEAAFPLSLLAGAWAILHSAPGAPRAATSIYAATLSACLGVSALYHRGPWSARVRSVMRRLDHCTIFTLVAGTFTPIAVVALDGSLRLVTLAVVWGGALAGAVVNGVRINLPAVAEVGPYIAIGLFGVVLIPHLMATLGPSAVALLGGGGAVYIAGAVIFAFKRPDPWPRWFGFHEIFHTAVIAAAAMQWVAITYWVLPQG
ncbi:MAG: PAQR family membrane homeostasis protein TrhA [Candidatus Dormibacteria bacterium]